MQYEAPHFIKTFFCNDCKKDVSCLRWKDISPNLNKGSQYKCDECWVKFEKDFDVFCLKTKMQMQSI